MKRFVFITLFTFLLCAALNAQLTGVKTIPGDYTTVAAAIADLNTNGVGSGGVTFNVAAGHTETFTLPSDGNITTTTSSASNPVTFIKSGTGASPMITAAPGIGTTDAIITFAGCDYVTFNGINLAENATNTTPTLQAEWGYAILKASGTDGSQNITIRNSKVSLTIGYTATAGIYSNNIAPGSTTQLTVTSFEGTNSNLKIYNDTINNCYNGIYVAGFNDPAAPYQYFDQNNEIGKDGGNVVTNVAGGSVAGYGIYTNYQNNLKVAGNRVTSTMAGTQAANGIYLGPARNSSYDLYNNLVSMQFSGTGASATLYAIYSEMGANGTSNTANIYGNTVTNCTYPTVTTAQTRLLHINSPGVTVNVYDNQVINNTIGALTSTATGQITHIYVNKTSTTAGTFSIHDNLVSGNTHIQSTPGSSTIYYLAGLGSGTNMDMFNNTVTNNVAGTSGTTHCLYVYFENGSKNVYSNLVSGITGAGGSTYGIYQTSSASNVPLSKFYQNTIRDIEGPLATTYLSGIYHTSGANSPHYYFNNYISDLRAPAATKTNAPYNSVNSFYVNSGSTISIFNNTAYIDASSTGANFGTSSIYMSTSARVDVRNNILVNTSVPNGLGKTNGLYFSSTTVTNYVNTSNYNNIYSGTPGPNNVLYNDGTVTEQTLAGLKNRMAPKEVQSVSEMPPFINVATKPYNLRLRNDIPTQCEAGGSIIGAPVPVISDFDGEARYPQAGYPVNPSFSPNNPDIGADEFGGLSNDLTAPAIAYTPLVDTNVAMARTLVATITDGSGIPTSGTGLPVLYWKINSGAYQPAQGTYISGNTYAFTFGAGTTNGDLVTYFIAAQDNAPTPNVGTYTYFGASGFTANPPACAIAPYAADDYLIVPNISGVFHVGVGKDYPTITAAATDINSKWIAGPVTLLLDDPTYPSEALPIVFLPNAGASTTSTLTIRPNTGNSATISGALNNSIFEFRGLDHFIIDGSNNGTTSKNLTIQNNSTVSGATGITISNNGGIDPASNFVIKNSIIQCTPVHSTIISIVNIRFSTTGGGYNNFKIQNNTLIGAFDGISTIGVASTGIISNGEITDNLIGSTNSGEYVTHYGIIVQYTDNILIRNNDIMGPAEGSLNIGQTGVYVGTLSFNTVIQRNKIHDFVRTADDGWGISGIWINTGNAAAFTEISNNQIYNIKSPGINPGVGQNITYGIFVRTGGNIQILHNSIYLTGQMSSFYDASSACIGFYYQASGNNKVVNNILRNSMTYLGAPSAWGRAYGIMVSAPPNTLFTQIDYNDFFIDGTSGAIAQQYTNGTGVIVDYITLADWQAATTQESHSILLDPQFTSPTNLLPTNPAMNNLGLYLPEVPVDYTGAMRNNPADIGAFEFGNDPFVITLSSNSVTTNSANITGAANPAGSSVSTFFDYGTSKSYGTSVAATPPTATGTTTTPISTSLSGLNYGTTYHYRARTVKTDGLVSYGADSTFTTLPLAPSVITTEATNILAYSATLNGSVNPNGGITSVTFEWGLTMAYGNTFTATPGSINGFASFNVSGNITGLTPYTIYHFRVVATNASGTIYGNDMMFTTEAIPSTVVTTLPTNILGFDATLNGTINANWAPTNASFEWGLTTAYGNTISATPSLVTGTTTTPVAALLNDLIPATEYHFRCVGTGPGGTVYGEDMMFISDCPTPVAAGAITGLQDVCVTSSGIVYSIDPIYLATGYTWAVPAGAAIVAGNNTSSITVDFSASAVSGDITVHGNNDCGIGGTSILPIVVHQLPVPTVTGSSTGCQGSFDNIYTTETGMMNYVWTVTGGTIDEGAGTHEISVTWNNTGTQTVSVSYSSIWGCYVAAPASMSVVVGNLAAPTISGNNMTCVNTYGNVYTTESGYVNYLWTVTSGGTITGGQGTYQIEVDWTGAGSQAVTVNYSTENGCYPAQPTSIGVTIMPAAGAAGEITGTPELCAGSEMVSYSISPVPNALGYSWSLPEGATIAEGENTNSIRVNFALNAESGDITVYATNVCGAGPASPAFEVTVNPIPPTPVVTTDENNLLRSSAPEGNQWYFEGNVIPGATGQEYQATEEGIYWTVVTLNGCSSDESNHIEVIFTGLDEPGGTHVSVYPVPNKGKFTVSVENVEEETYTIFIYNEIGIEVYKKADFQVIGNARLFIDLVNPSNGMYTMLLAGERRTITRKLFVTK